MKLLYIQTHLIIFWDSNKERVEHRLRLADVLTFVTDTMLLSGSVTESIHGLAGAWPFTPTDALLSCCY